MKELQEELGLLQNTVIAQNITLVCLPVMTCTTLQHYLLYCCDIYCILFCPCRL